MNDEISKKIMEILKESKEPLQTLEIVSKMQVSHDTTRTIVLYRLNDLRGEGRIMGKKISAGRGAWIWWT